MRRRRLLLVWRGLLGLFAAWLAATVMLGMNPSVPVDVVLNLAPAPARPGLRAPDDGRRHVVVLVHGLWRSAQSLARLERALEDHGYTVLNESYPSTTETIGVHARALRQRMRAVVGDPASGRTALHYVAHSMGGLVVQEALRRGAPEPESCVFVATPHRGAALVDERRDLWVFRLLLGHEAALQLAPGNAFHDRPLPAMGRVGTVIGARGDGEGWNDDIDGDDDGTVAVEEAHCPVEDASVTVRAGHTAITFDGEVIVHVLHFLRHGRFAT